ncbi:hypothetical protein [Morganella morganii]
MAITAERKKQLEKIAIRKSVEKEKAILWTDLVNDLIDNFLLNEEKKHNS